MSNAIYSAGAAVENGILREIDRQEASAEALDGLAEQASKQLRAEFLEAAKVGPKTLLDVPGESKALTMGHWLAQELDEAAIVRLLEMASALLRGGMPAAADTKSFWSDMADLYDKQCCDALVERLEESAKEEAEDDRAEARWEDRRAA